MKLKTKIALLLGIIVGILYGLYGALICNLNYGTDILNLCLIK